MPISSISSDYTGRTIDISILQGVNPSGTATVNPSFGQISNYCTGIQKLVQRYAIALLTQVGSQINFPTFGTSLMTGLNNRNVVVGIGDLSNTFNVANIFVINTFLKYQRLNPGPADEQLNTAVLNNITSNGDAVNISVTIYPVQQPSVTFILPIPLDN